MSLIEEISREEYEAAYYHRISQQRARASEMEPGDFLKISHKGLICRGAPRKSCSIHSMLSRLNKQNPERRWHSKHTEDKDAVLVACYRRQT
jgi:hypothetical protein